MNKCLLRKSESFSTKIESVVEKYLPQSHSCYVMHYANRFEDQTAESTKFLAVVFQSFVYA